MELTLNPSGHLVMIETSAAESVDPHSSGIARAFAESQAAGIIALAGGKTAPDWPFSWLYWRDFGARYLLQLCQNQATAKQLEPSPDLDPATLASLHLSIPPMPGSEYCTPEVLGELWSPNVVKKSTTP